MWLPLAQLPSSLLVASLALAASALPTVESVQLTQLTPDSFKQTIAEGVWFIEHFSPYCGHCRKFAPTWEKLVEENLQAPDPGISLAQVNCAVHGDLCEENKVSGYPQMNLYRNGEYVEWYKGGREYDLITEYLAKHAEPKIPRAASTSAAAPAVASPSDRNPLGQVLVLDASTFDRTVREGPMFVKFFAPWCGHCKKLKPHWADLAQQMQHRLTIAEVDCEDHPALCKREGIQGYPVLSFYPGGGSKTEYNGGRKIEQLKDFAEKAVAPAVQELKPEEFAVHVTINSVLFLLLHSDTDNAIVNQLTQAAQVLLGTAPVFTTSAPEFFARYKLTPSTGPVLLVLKDNDAAPAAQRVLSSTTQTDELRQWLRAHSLPTALELTAETFQAVMNAPHGPLVVVAGVPAAERAQYAQQVRDVARQWRQRTTDGTREILFTWMDADRWGSWLKKMYGLKTGAEPAVVIAEHARLIYYDTDGAGRKLLLTTESLFPTLDGALKGTLSPRYSENFVERIARYLNDKLISVEWVLVNHPWRTGLFVICALGILFLVIQRFLLDDLRAENHRVLTGASHARKGRID